MTEIIKHTYMLRRGTADEWMRINPLLNVGEPGYEVDTHRLKIGDGFNDWLSLPYISSSIIYTHTLPKVGESGVFYVLDTDNSLWLWIETNYICVGGNTTPIDIADLTQQTDTEVIFDCGSFK